MIIINKKLAEEALNELKASQQDYYVQSTQNVIDKLQTAISDNLLFEENTNQKNLHFVKQRLEQLRGLIEELKSDCYSEQYGLADFVETDQFAKRKMNVLSKESAFYQDLLNRIKT